MDNQSKSLGENAYKTRQSLESFIFNTILVQLVILFTSLCIFLLFRLVNLDVTSQIRLFLVILFLILIADFIFCILSFFDWKYTHYIIKPYEIVVKTGVVSTREKVYQLNQLATATVQQNFFGKIFNYGTLRLFSPLLESKLELYNIPTPMEFRNLIVKFVELQNNNPEKARIIVDNTPNIQEAS